MIGVYNGLRFDLRAGKRYLLLSVALGATVAFTVILGGWVKASAYQIDWSEFTLGDNALLILAGLLPPDQIERDSILFPIGWMLLWTACALAPIAYVGKYGKGYFGVSSLLKSKKRSSWFLAKCIWALIATFLFWIAVAITAMFLTSINSGHFSLEASSSIEAINLSRNDELLDSPYDLTSFLLMIPLIGALFVLPLVVISLLKNELFAFLTVLVLLLPALLIVSGFIPGEYLMAVRSDCFLSTGISSIQSLAYAVLVGFFSTLVGALIFRGSNIVGMVETYD